ncbi:MAG: Hsp20/alpha crystallin family protein [Treponemataceae bacterium]
MKNALSIFSPSFEEGLLQSIGTGFNLLGMGACSAGIPSVDIKQTDDAYLLDMELPGFDEKDVDINLHEQILTISSTHNEDKEEKKDEDGVQYLVRERSSRSFTRRFSLPSDTNCENITAKFNRGVLEVTIPRNPETKPRNIQISK